MSRRGRAIGFAGLALVCAVASASIASGYRESVDERLGELRSVVTGRAAIAGRRRPPRPACSARRSPTRTVPARFLPPDAIADAAQVSGRRTLAGDPGRVPTCWPPICDRPSGGRRRGRGSDGDLHPVEVTVSAAGSLASDGSAGARESTSSSPGEPVTGGRARVRVAARGCPPDLGSSPPIRAGATTVGGDSWSATLALTRAQALELIEAENFAREIRLIPAS